jgi:3'(2'), 5'-bisphosphate nucleotidase
MTTTDDHALAGRLAERAGALLLAVRRAASGDSVGSLGADGDRAAHELLVEALRRERPDDAVLSEEEKSEPPEVAARRQAASRVWIVDPLDGTREFSEGRADFAVHVALVEDGVPTAAAVALPAEQLVLTTKPPMVVPPRPEGPLRLLVSRTRPPVEATAVAGRLGAEMVAMGSAGAKTMAVVRGLGDIYLHAGGQYEWDSAAPVGVAVAAGLHASRLDGSALLYNRPDPWMPDLLVCRPELLDQVLSALSTAS